MVNDLKKKYKEILDLINDEKMTKDVEKAEGGNKAAIVRVRKCLQECVKMSKVFREDLLNHRKKIDKKK